MAKKIFCGVCAAIALLSCTLFTCIDYSRNFQGPLFYRHYITYNVRAAYHDTQSPQPQNADNTFCTVEWLGVAAAVNTGHSFKITSALLDLNELGIYKLTNADDQVYRNNTPFAWTEADERAGVIEGTRFKTGVSAMAFSTEDLKTLAETIVNPVTVENLLINYTYDGREYTDNVPIGKITLYSADSRLNRLTEDITPDCPAMMESLPGTQKFTLSFRVRPGCTVKSVSLPYTQASAALLPLTLNQKPDGTITAALNTRFDKAGLVYFQLDYIIRGTDENGSDVTAVSEYQNYSFLTMSRDRNNVLAELKQRKEPEQV